MNIKEAEILCQAGALETPIVKRHESGAGWMVALLGNHKLNPVLKTARGQVRIFKSLDAAVGVLFGIGFDEIRIIQSE